MSKYGDALDALDQEESSRASVVQAEAAKVNSDQYAKAIDIARDRGVPAHIIAANPEPYLQKSKYGAALDAMDAPVTSEWQKTYDNAAVSHDDTESLSALERAIRFTKTGAISTADVFRSAPSGAFQSVGSSLSGIGALNDAGARSISRGARALGLEGAADFLDTPIPNWANPSEWLKFAGGQWKESAQLMGAPEERQNIATDISGGLGQLSAQIAISLFTGGTVSTVTLLGSGADQQAERTAAAGATAEQTDMAVVAGAAITALTERYGLDAILNRVPPMLKNRILSRIADAAAGGGIEAAQEVVEGVLHNLTAAAIYNPDAPIFEGLDREAMAAGGSGAIARAIISAVTPGRLAIGGDHAKRAADQVHAAAQESKLATRSPAKLEELVSQIKEATGSEHAYVDAEAFRTLFQSDQEAAQAAADLTGSDRTYFEAAVSGGKMAIPLEKYVSKIATNKASAAILDFVTFSPDGVTAAEAKEDRAGFDDKVKAITESVATDARPDSSEAIYNDALDQLESTGMERSAAEKNAALTQAVFRTLGQRTGMDAQELYKRYGLKIQRQGIDSGTVLNQSDNIGAMGRMKLSDLPRDMREELFNNHATGVNPEVTERQFLSKRVPSGMINIEDIHVDDIQAEQLERYSDIDKLPPIVIADGKLIDGQHRIQAARAKGITKLPYIDLTGLIDTNESGFVSELPKGTKAKNAVAVKYDQRFEETKRGAIQFGTDRKFTVSLFEKADLSTFLHESGHFYLEILGDLAAGKDAPQQVKDDFATIRKWMKLKDGEAIGTDQHEQFARGFEAYLMDGKAPSIELQSTFARFRAWLISVYRTLSKLNVELTDDVRKVMDRLVATDEEIQAAEESQNYAPIFTTAEEAGMSPEQWSAYKDIATRAHQEAIEDLSDRAMKELSREQKAWWKEERAKVLEQVTAGVIERPVYVALDAMRAKDGPKLNRKALVDRYSDKYGKDFIKHFPKVTAKDGGDLDVAAQLYGFESGDALVDAIMTARPKDQIIQMETDALMKERHGDIMADGSLAESALQSVHSDARAKVMAAELKALNRKRREVQKFVSAEKKTEAREARESREANAATLPDADELRAIKAAAERAIQSKKIREIQPNQFRMAEARASRKAFKFAGSGKFEEAYIEKRRQIYNHELYRAAASASEEIDSIVKYMKTFDKKATRERLAKERGRYLEQIDALRERFDFSKVSKIADLQRTALAAWVAEQEAAGRETNVPEYLLNEALKTPYKELILAELQGLHDAVKNIEHLAKTKDRMLKNRAASDWATAKDELLERVKTALPEGREPPLGRFEQSRLALLAEKARGIADSILRPETIIEWLDGGTEGPWHDYMWNQANDSQDVREKMRDRISKPLFDLSQKITRARRNELQQMVRIPSMNRSLNRRTLVSIALNMGNASNLDKLQRGGYRTKDGSQSFTERNLQEINDALTKEDWTFVQTVWDTVDQLWPDVVEFQKRMGGLAPEKVEATSVQTKHGVFRGGYFPLVYDQTVSTQGEKQVAGDAVQEIMGQNFTRASTKKGHTKARTKVARPILFDFERVITRHLDQVITDLSHREFVLQAMKILDDGELRAQIQNRIGEGAYRSLQGMVRHAVRADGGYGDPAAAGWDKAQDYLIRNTAVAALGFRAATAFGNLVLAPVQAAARIPPKQILKGIGEFYRAPREMTDFIHGRSEFMKQRATNMDQTLVETMANLRGERSIRAQVARAAMSVHRWADFLGTHGLWLGKYQEILDAGGSEESAVREADKAIRQTQTAGAPKDLSSFERDPRYKAFRLFLGPMVITGNRIRESLAQRGVVRNWPEALGTLMAVWFIPAMLWEIATGKGPDDEDEPEDIALWALRKEFFYPFMTVPILRDIASMVERNISGQYAPSRSVPLAEAGELVYKAGEEAAKAGVALWEGDEVETRDLAKDVLKASGPLLGVPSGQLNITGTYLYDVFSGEYDPEGVGDLRYLAVKRDPE